MQKIEYKTSTFSIKEFEALGQDCWIYTFCPKLEDLGKVLFYRPLEKKAVTRSPKEILETPEFVKFYNAYPNKKARPMACKAWNRLTPADQKKAMEALGKHSGYWKYNKTAKHLIPHPATWLNGARWEDDLGEWVKTLDELKKDEILIAQRKEEARLKAIEEEKSREEWSAVTRIMADLQLRSPERFKVIYDEALTHFTEEQQAMQFFKPMLDARIRSIIHDKYVQGIEPTNGKNWVSRGGETEENPEEYPEDLEA